MTITPPDLSRLLTLHAIHGGESPCLRDESADRLAAAGLVELLEFPDSVTIWRVARITEAGRRVAEAMVAAGLRELGEF